MIQRIQSIFLFGTALITGLMFVMPAGTIVVPGQGIFEYYTSQVVMTGEMPEHMATNWVSLILNVLITLLALITVFVRVPKSKSVRPTLLLQLRLCLVNLVFMLGMLILLWLQLRGMADDIHAEWSAGLGFSFPIVGIILTWIAIRYIVKDIALLRSYDRIR